VRSSEPTTESGVVSQSQVKRKHRYHFSKKTGKAEKRNKKQQQQQSCCMRGVELCRGGTSTSGASSACSAKWAQKRRDKGPRNQRQACSAKWSGHWRRRLSAGASGCRGISSICLCLLPLLPPPVASALEIGSSSTVTQCKPFFFRR
jgi:hypothetical protein